MNKRRILLLQNIVYALFLLAACGQATSEFKVIQPTETPNDSTIIALTNDVLSTTTPPYSAKNVDILEKCLDTALLNPLTSITAKGAIVFVDNHYSLDILPSIFLLDLETFQTVDISELNSTYSYRSMSISPNRKYMVYGVTNINSGAENLIVTNSKGEPQQEIMVENLPPFYTATWLNDQQIEIASAATSSIVNILTGEKDIYSYVDFPGYSQKDDRFYFLRFDPSIMRAVYWFNNSNIVLVDIKTKQVLAEIPDNINRTPQVAWSPDGSRAAIVGTVSYQEQQTALDLVYSDEIFIVTKDGEQVGQITNFAQIYSPQSYNIYNLVWSPDGRSISFWLVTWGTEPLGGYARLFVLNTQTKQVTDYCVWSKHDDNVYFGPIWSPDSKQLLIEHRNEDNTLQSVVFDLAKGEAFIIADDKLPVGWMETQP